MGRFEVEIKWGIYFSFIVLVWAFLEKSFGLYDQHIGNYAIYTNLFAPVAILLYVLALREKKKTFFKNAMNWKQGFVSGIYLTVVITVLTPLCQLMIHRIIAPELLPNLINYKVVSGHLTKENAQLYFNIESYIYQSSSFALSVGVVTSAIVAYFVRTKN